VLNAFRDAGYEPNVRFMSEDYQALQGMAASGIGVALIPSLALISSRSDVVVLPLRGRAPARHILAAVRTGEDDPLVEHMVEALRGAARRLAGGPPLAAVA
jgi:DNA-binding transcriptional LysR family regulator